MRRRSASTRLDFNDNPYAGLKEGDAVLLGWVGNSAFDWRLGKVLWHDGCEVLVEQYGIAGSRQHNHLTKINQIRAFGTAAFCSDQKRAAEQASLGAARQLRELEDMVVEVRQAVNKLIAGLNAAALRASNDPSANGAGLDATPPP